MEVKGVSLPNVSIVILTHNSMDHVGKLLISLSSLSYENFKVVVIDNASKDGTTDFVKESFPFVELIVNPRNVGYGRAYNSAIHREFVRGADYVLILNPDVLVEPDFLKPLVEGAVRHNLDIASPLVLDGDGHHVENALKMCLAECLDWQRGIQYGPLQQCYEVTRLVGASLLISRKAFKTTGGFDTIYFLYYEDFDLCRLAHACGLRMGVITSSRILHFSKLNRLECISAQRFFHTIRSGGIYQFSDPERSMVSNSWAMVRYIVSVIRAAPQYRYTSRLILLPIILLLVLFDLPSVVGKYRMQNALITGRLK